jgi:uncharacterized UBP type Zn finger protein
MREKFEYQTGVIRLRKVKDWQCNGQKEKKRQNDKSIYKALPRTLDLEHHKHNLKPRW